jgi:predicted SprT family Zn-dependent metalloprotease
VEVKIQSPLRVQDVNLGLEFDRINAEHFSGILKRDQLTIRWNSRLRSSAGRFTPGKRMMLFSWNLPARIEIAFYLLEEPNAIVHIRDTLAHEMIHYWLWVRKRPYGHTEEFVKKMREMGVSRYNQVPKKRPYKYIYHCLACFKEYPARRRLGRLACGSCCRTLNRGRYDESFRLVLK